MQGGPLTRIGAAHAAGHEWPEPALDRRERVGCHRAGPSSTRPRSATGHRLQGDFFDVQADPGEGSALKPFGVGQMNIPLTVIPTVLGIVVGVPLTVAPVDEQD